MSTASVLKDIQRNLTPEFERLFREHHSFVYRTAYGVTGRVEDADDVVQTVFLRLLRREIPPDLSTNPSAYLYRAAFNAAVSILRSRRRNTVGSVEEVETPAAPPIPGVDEDTRRELYDASRNSVRRPHRFLSSDTLTTTTSRRSQRPWAQRAALSP